MVARSRAQIGNVMMNGSMRETLIVMIFTAVSGIAAAQDDDRFYVSPFWGGSLMKASTDGARLLQRRFEGGFQLGARFGYRLSRRIAIEAAYRYSPNGGSVFYSVIGIDEIDRQRRFTSQIESHAVTGDIRFFALDTGNAFRPFLAAGLGVEIFRASGRSESSLTWNVGGGGEWSLRPGLGVRGDVRYVAISDFFLTGRTEGGVELHGSLVVGF